MEGADAPRGRTGRVRPVSMANVARAAGVSQQTVSRVANDAPNVNAETRARVRKAMADLGFRPNYAGRSLRSGTYRAVGLCLYNVNQYGNLSTLDGIMAAARGKGYAVAMVEVGDDNPVSLGEASRRLAELPVDGIILSMSVMASDFEEFRPLAGMGTVLLSVPAHPFCTTVDSDQYGGGLAVMDYLLGLGHRQIRHLAGPGHSVDASFRRAAWADALAARGVSAVEPLVGDWTADSGYELGARLARDCAMTAVYVANDTMALGVIAALRDAGRRVPEDVSVVGTDDSLVGTVPDVGLTTVRFDLIRRGHEAFEQALLASAPDYETRAVRIPGTLVERRSVSTPR